MLPLWLLIVFVGYGIPLWLLYIVILIQLMRARNRQYFHSTFFSIAILIGLIDIVEYVVTFVFIKLPMNPRFGPFLLHFVQESGVTVCFYFLYHYLHCVKGIAVIVSAFNRMLAVLRPLAFLNFRLQEWRTPISLSLCAGIPFVYSAWIFVADVIVVPFSLFENNTYIVIVEFEWIPMVPVYVNAVHNLIVGLLGSLFNLTAVLVLRKRCRQEFSNSAVGVRKAEQGMLAVVAWDVCFQLLYSVQELTMAVLAALGQEYSPAMDRTCEAGVVIGDLDNLSRPILLTAHCSQLRKSLLALFFRSSSTLVKDTPCNVTVSPNDPMRLRVSKRNRTQKANV